MTESEHLESSANAAGTHQVQINDDYDDGWDDDDIFAAPARKPGAPARAAGASKLAEALCDPPPLRPNGKTQRGAIKEPSAVAKHQPSYPITPPSPGSAMLRVQARDSSMVFFAFDSPSPDDVVLAAQQGKPVGPQKVIPASTKSGSTTISLPQSRFLSKPTPAHQRLQEEASALSAESPLHSPQKQSRSGAHRPVHERRRVGDYKVEADPASACPFEHKTSAFGCIMGEQRPGLHVVTLGHFNSGKSTLVGRMLYDLGVVGQKEAHKLSKDAAQAGKASSSWAWAVDERRDERSHAATIDIAIRNIQTDCFNVTLLDSPGLPDYVPNMIAGATQADAALLVVDGSLGCFESGFQGSDGGYVCGQTVEHARLAHALGVEQVAVIVTKLDTCNFSQERFEHIKARLHPFLTGCCGFRAACIQWLPAVAPLGENVMVPPTEPLLGWWSGPTVVQAVNAFCPRERSLGRPLRVPVTDVFKAKSGATAVGGKVASGAVKVGMRVAVAASSLQHSVATVKSLEVHGQPSQVARAGDSVSLVLGGLDADELKAGVVLSHSEFAAPLVSHFEARVQVLDVKVPLARGQQVALYCHTARDSAVISSLVAVLETQTGEPIERHPRFLASGQTALIEISSAHPMCIEEFADYQALGLIALRDKGRTLAVGMVARLLG